MKLTWIGAVALWLATMVLLSLGISYLVVTAILGHRMSQVWDSAAKGFVMLAVISLLDRFRVADLFVKELGDLGSVRKDVSVKREPE